MKKCCCVAQTGSISLRSVITLLPAPFDFVDMCVSWRRVRKVSNRGGSSLDKQILGFSNWLGFQHPNKKERKRPGRQNPWPGLIGQKKNLKKLAQLGICHKFNCCGDTERFQTRFSSINTPIPVRGLFCIKLPVVYFGSIFSALSVIFTHRSL
jgi:hypothetical protein